MASLRLLPTDLALWLLTFRHLFSIHQPKIVVQTACNRATIEMEVMEVDDEFAWINELKVMNKTNLGELREALVPLNSYQTLKDVNGAVGLRDHLDTVCYVIRVSTLQYAEIRRIAQFIRTCLQVTGCF